MGSREKDSFNTTTPPPTPPHPGLQGSIKGSSLIHLSCELVMGRKGRVYKKDMEWDSREISLWGSRMSRRVQRSLGFF